MVASAQEKQIRKGRRAGWLQVRADLPRRTRSLLGWGMVGILVLVWLAVTLSGSVVPLLLPSPIAVAQAGVEMAARGDLLPSVQITMMRIGQALLLVVVVGVALGTLMGAFSVFDSLLEPIVAGAKSVPTTALMALVMLWFGIEERAKVVFLFLGAIFFMVLLVRDAIKGVRQEYVLTALDLGAGGMRTVLSVLLPGAAPQISGGVIVCNGIMWTYVLLAEFLNARSGLGHLINNASRLGRSDRVFAGVITIALVSVCTDWVLRRIQQRWFAY